MCSKITRLVPPTLVWLWYLFEIQFTTFFWLYSNLISPCWLYFLFSNMEKHEHDCKSQNHTKRCTQRGIPPTIPFTSTLFRFFTRFVVWLQLLLPKVMPLHSLLLHMPQSLSLSLPFSPTSQLHSFYFVGKHHCHVLFFHSCPFPLASLMDGWPLERLVLYLHLFLYHHKISPLPFSFTHTFPNGTSPTSPFLFPFFSPERYLSDSYLRPHTGMSC